MKKQFVLSLALLLIFCSTANSQWVRETPNHLHALCFTSIGSTLFAGADSGVFISTDSGAHWALSGLADTQVNKLAANGSIVFAGTENEKVFVSTDYGNSWQSPGNGGLATNNIEAMCETGSFLLVGTYGGAGTSVNCYRSPDNGATWSAANVALGVSDVFAIGYSDGILGAATQRGLYLSTDQGASWSRGDTRIADTDFRAISFLGATLFAGTNGDGVFLTTTVGATWARADTGIPSVTYTRSFCVVQSNIFVSTYNHGVFLSTDMGLNWSSANPALGDTEVNDLISFGGYLFAATGDSGIWRLPLNQMVTLAVHPRSSVENALSVYPNPAGSSTTNSIVNISSHLTDGGYAEVSIVNLLGVEVARLFSGELVPGDHEFSWDTHTVEQGIYECILRIKGNVQRVSLSVVR
jgi:photosystem II stability/assembly factor-like uncharacterized protein